MARNLGHAGAHYKANGTKSMSLSDPVNRKPKLLIFFFFFGERISMIMANETLC